MKISGRFLKKKIYNNNDKNTVTFLWDVIYTFVFLNVFLYISFSETKLRSHSAAIFKHRVFIYYPDFY